MLDIANGKSRYVYDDAGGRGGLPSGSLFVIAGDQNWTRSTPDSLGAVQQNALQGGANLTSDPRFDTADFADTAPGNLRADYVLPRRNMWIVDAGVFWPLASDPLFRLVGTFPFPTSDHRLVRIDADLPGK